MQTDYHDFRWIIEFYRDGVVYVWAIDNKLYCNVNPEDCKYWYCIIFNKQTDCDLGWLCFTWHQ